MASRSETARQDQATEQRRTDACAKIVAHTRIEQGDWPDDDHHSGLATGVLSALIEAIEGERDDIIELRRKGWQTKAREQDAAIVAVKEWRDDLIAFKPPSTSALPQPVEIPVSARADTPAELDARLEAAFGIPTPVRHIRTVIEHNPAPDDGSTTYGNLCGATDGSLTHPSGANCPDCHAIYAEQNDGKPYEGPTAHGTELPVLTPAWSDGPVTPQVARAMREAGSFTVPDPDNMPNAHGPTIGEIVADRAAGAAGVIEPFEQIRRDAVEQVGETLATRAADEQAKGIDAGGVALAAFVGMPTVIEPSARRPARERMTAAQVREHGLARQRGALHRSVSQVQGFADCGTRAALSDLERPAWWNVGGKAFHACAEEINRYAADDMTAYKANHDALTSNELWLKHFDAQIAEQCAATPDHPMDTWRAANKGSEHYDWWRVEGPVMVQKYVIWLSSMIAEGWRIATAPDVKRYPATELHSTVPVIEYETRLDVGLQVPNLSIIDLALSRTSNNPDSELHAYGQEVLIVDLKAGNSAPKDTFQLGVYGWCALAAGIAQHPAQVRGAYYRARRGELTPVLPVLDLHPWPDVVQRYRDQDAMERQGIYMPNVTTFCGGCGVRDLCPAQASS